MMLTESFIAATLTPDEQVNAANLGIRIQQFQPLSALKSSFKKSSSNPNCVVVNRTHIFAAQAEKAVVNVYSRERNNQEATVPFPERITSLTLAGEKDEAGILVLGTEGGRVILWELGTGRQVFTPQHHLQHIVCLAVDLGSAFVLSGSSDSTIHVWSILDLLSFSKSVHSFGDQSALLSPQRSLSAHRTPITALAFGHSMSSINIAVSASRDGTCIVWDYFTGTALHTYLLPSSPLCLVLDPADRAFYSGHEDGSVLIVNFYENHNVMHPLHDPAQRATPSQPKETEKWRSPDGSNSAALSIALSYDGTILLSGHRSGKIHTWDVASGRFQKELMDLSVPVTSLMMLPPDGFPNERQPNVKLHRVMKPQYESFAGGGSSSDSAEIPSTYTYNAQFTSTIPVPGSQSQSDFQKAMTNPLFSPALLEKGLAQFSSSRDPQKREADSSASEDLRSQNAALLTQIETALTEKKKVEAASKVRDREAWARRQDDHLKAMKKKRRRLARIRAEEVMRKKEMGEEVEVGDGEVKIEDEEDLSSSTEEE